jgi:hypothetical protein
MSWVPSFLKRKTHKYETQADLDKLTADEIIHLDPKEVGFYVEKNEGGVKLTGPKRTSMLRLLSIKRDEKNNPSLIRLRASVVDKLTNQDKEVEKLMRDTQAEIDSGNTMRNRLTLLDMPQVPTTRPTISRKGGRKSINTIKRRASRAKRAIRRSSKMSYKRMQRTRRR